MSNTPEALIRTIAECCHAMAFQSGEPGVDLAGHTLSFLAAHPEHIERYMLEGNELWVDGTISSKGAVCATERLMGISECRMKFARG